jgi:hypothetical protein
VSNRFDPLTAEQMAFLETFLRCRGIIRDVEAALGISYPTVVSRLDDLVAAISGTPGAPAPAPTDGPRATRRQKILDDLQAGVIGADEAARLLRES